MHCSSLAALAATVVTVAGQYKGFNYGSTFTNGSPKQEADFVNEFNRAQNLPGASGFTSARLFTTVQAGTANAPISAIPAAISTRTSLLLGIWASAGQANIDNEIAALTAAINQYGTAFTDLIAGISVGSEDLYRNSPIGISNESGIGANPDDLVNFIGQVRRAISGTSAGGKPVGHVDTWTAYVNASNNAVISALDFVGVDAYPYFQNTQSNGIESGAALFNEAYAATVGAAQGKPVWITETGWPVSGPTSNLAVASPENAKTYWDAVGCANFGVTNTWWFTIQDAAPDTPSPSFGIIGSDLNAAPFFDLTCPGGAAPASSSAPSTVLQPTIPATTAAPIPTTLATVTTPAPPAPPAPTQPSTSSCPANLSGPFEFPHLIIPIDRSAPTTPSNTVYAPRLSPSISDLFNFDIPPSTTGQTCSLIFLLPTQDRTSYTLTGAGGLAVSRLSQPAVEGLSYNTAPSSNPIGSVPSLVPGTSAVIASGPCEAGSRVGYRVDVTGTLDLSYFQNSDPNAPIGLYVSIC